MRRTHNAKPDEPYSKSIFENNKIETKHNLETKEAYSV